jgi:hypothetical protein
MFTKAQKVIVCEVTINCPGIPTYHNVRLLPAVGSPEGLIRSELRKLFKANGIEVNEKALSVEVKEVERKIIYPIFELLRYCANCDLTAQQAGVKNEEFEYCGKCGKPTGLIFQDPK